MRISLGGSALLSAVLIFVAGCSDASHSVTVDEGIEIPREVADAIPVDNVIAQNDSADFNGDGDSDSIVGYGPLVGGSNTQIGVLIDVGGVVTRFSRPDSNLAYSVEDVTGEGTPDLTVTWAEVSLTCRYSFQGNTWVAIDGLASCQDAATTV
jgi:hypothetical protein